MEQWITLLTEYGYMGILILLFVQMILVITAIHMLKRLKRHVETIQNRVTNYLAVVMEEEEEEKLPQGHVVSEQERRMVESLTRKKAVSQEELFNAVLQEIFP